MFDLVRYYLLRVSHDEVEEETVVVHNTSDHSLVPILVHFLACYWSRLHPPRCWAAHSGEASMERS